MAARNRWYTTNRRERLLMDQANQQAEEIVVSYTPNNVTQQQYNALKGQSVTNIKNMSASGAINAGDEAEVTTGANDVTVTINTPSSVPGLAVVKKMDSGAGRVLVVDSSGKLIDNAAQFVIGQQFQSNNFLWDGTQYAVN